MPQNLTKDYIHQHLSQVHTYDSFARALESNILHEVINQTSAVPVPEFKVDAEITVKPVEALGCIEVCVGYGEYKVCKHVNV
ncbi:hypothetical protein [Bacillus sp. GG161]|uniref:hypothetical protein n=1 Tax=unclassified Bacillus (in: firmicutes) TaxID=185979 RepID=UPI001C0E0764|nr:hypothetical protein [Bacillus sp. GG161]MBU4617841.1 hypothetical protein [Bacillus sp. GG161]